MLIGADKCRRIRTQHFGAAHLRNTAARRGGGVDKPLPQLQAACRLYDKHNTTTNISNVNTNNDNNNDSLLVVVNAHE